MRYFTRPTGATQMLDARSQIESKISAKIEASRSAITEAETYLQSTTRRILAGTTAGGIGSVSTMGAFALFSSDYASAALNLLRAGQIPTPALLNTVIEQGGQTFDPQTLLTSLPVSAALMVGSIAYVGMVTIKEGRAERRILHAEKDIEQAEAALKNLARSQPDRPGSQSLELARADGHAPQAEIKTDDRLLQDLAPAV
jgi:hypothetical protein